MRKPVLFLPVLLLCSCDALPAEVTPLPLIERQVNAASYQRISTETLAAKLESQATFVLYIFASSCMGCRDFAPILEGYISDTGALIYAIDAEAEGLPRENPWVPYSTTPTLCVLEGGACAIKADTSGDGAVFSSRKSLEEFMNQTVILSSRINVPDEASLGKLLREREDCIVYYGYEYCSDCIVFYDAYMKQKLAEGALPEFYYFEMEEYFKLYAQGDRQSWTEFTSGYGLSAEGSPMGYRTGVVPMLIRYQSGIPVKTCVIFNDTFEETSNDKGEILSVKVTGSYYPDAPQIGTTFYPEEGKSAKAVYREATLAFFAEKFEEIFR